MKQQESSSAPSLFGIECFVSDHCGFSGHIKHDCKDFEVTELDIHGKMVQFDGTNNVEASVCSDPIQADKIDGDAVERSQAEGNAKHLEDKSDEEEQTNHNFLSNNTSVQGECGTCPSSTSSKRKAGLSVSNAKLCYASVIRIPEACQYNLQKSDSDNKGRSSGSKPMSAYLARLKEILGDDVMEKLTAFAESEYSLHQINKGSSDEQGVSEKNALFSVGVISSKEIRTEIHGHIKYIFPHLCTKVQKPSSSEDGLSITVQSDIIYWDFEKCLAANEVNEFVRFVDAKDPSQTFGLTISGGKEERTCVHRKIAKHYGAFLETKTFVSSDGPSKEKTSKIVVRYRQKFVQRGARGRGQKRKATDQDTVFTGFVLKKENLETLDVINKMAAALGVHPSDFSYAGLKDKKAVTVQAMSVKRITAERVRSHFSKIQIQGVSVGNIHHLQGPIQLGQLSGNHFEIVIRDVRLKEGGTDHGTDMFKVEEEVEEAVENVKANWFINYFGQQRFGSTTDIQGNAANIGLEILNGDHVRAVKLLLSPDSAKDDAVNKAKRHFQETQDAKTALSMMPGFKSRECMLLKALHRHGTDKEGCTKALLNIPHAMRQLYVHSYCSLVWNQMATQRMRVYGNQLVEGDLVLPAGTAKQFTRTQVQVVTEEAISSKAFTIDDLVLPLPGNAIQYPSNNIGKLYQKHLQQAGLSQTSFRINSLKINIPGDYRKVFACPQNLAYRLTQEVCPLPVEKTSSETSLSRTITGPTSDGESSSKEQCHIPCSVDGPQSKPTSDQLEEAAWMVYGSSSDGEIHLKLSFSLPASSYATMCLREIMKE